MGTKIKPQSFPLQGRLLPELSWSRICILFHTTHQAATEKCSSISLYILSGKGFLFLHSNKLSFATGGYELSWKLPGFRYQWYLGNCFHQATFNVCSHWNKNHGSVLNTEHVQMHWTASSFADFWREMQVSEVLHVVCSVTSASKEKNIQVWAISVHATQCATL